MKILTLILEMIYMAIIFMPTGNSRYLCPHEDHGFASNDGADTLSALAHASNRINENESSTQAD